MRRVGRIVLLALLAVVRPADAASVDLLAQAPLTSSVRSGGIQPGSRLAQPSLGRQWQPIGDGIRARSFARRSRVDLEVPSGTAAGVGRELLVSCAVPDAPPSGVRTSILLNGRRLGIVRFVQELQLVRFPLEARKLRPGRNRLELKKPAGNAEAGRGALLCDFFAIAGVAAEPVPAMHRANGLHAPLVLQPDARFEVFIRHARAGRLEVEVCSGGGTLSVEGPRGPIHTGRLEQGPPQVIPLTWAKSGFAVVGLVAGATGAQICRLEWKSNPPPSQLPVPGYRGDTTRPRNVLLIVVDTLRADRLGAYGSERGLTPAMDALAAQGIVFENVVAQSAWTSPATASILTGTDPTTHGIRRLGDTIDAAAPALASVLGEAGYATAAITTNINVRAELGFDRGFSTYRYLPESEAREGFYAQAAEVQAEALGWLDAQSGRPFFLYLHLSEPHAPYAPAPEAAQRFVRGSPSPEVRAAVDPLEHLSSSHLVGREKDLDWVRSLYDAEVASVDAIIGALRKNLEERGLWQETLFVLTSDHGEAFGEHGVAGHGYSVFAEEVQVPLIFRWNAAQAAGSGQRSSELARQIDVLPTILDLLGISVPPAVEGVSLLREVPGEAFSETQLHGREKSGLIVDGLKVVRTQGRTSGSTMAVYDLSRDPQEGADVLRDHPYLAGWSAQEFHRRNFQAPATPRVGKDPAIEKRLRMLGYVE